MIDTTASGSDNLQSVERSGAFRNTPSRLPLLTLILLIGVATLLYIAPRDPDIAARIQRWRTAERNRLRETEFSAQLKSDPAVGKRLLPAKSGLLKAPIGSNGQSPKVTDSVCVVFIGPCASCITSDVRKWQEVTTRISGARLVLVSRDTPERIRDFIKKEHLSIPIVEDPDGNLARTFNALWVPRAYLLTKDGTLKAIQKNDSLQVEAVAAEFSRV